MQLIALTILLSSPEHHSFDFKKEIDLLLVVRGLLRHRDLVIGVRDNRDKQVENNNIEEDGRHNVDEEQLELDLGVRVLTENLLIDLPHRVRHANNVHIFMVVLVAPLHNEMHDRHCQDHVSEEEEEGADVLERLHDDANKQSQVHAEGR